ncbi:siderophore-interacting protein [Herbiconiux sp. P15]|uniref:siderophore-interacting protein n=1 Tax=Herbiconiux liukaitaii TaxID=3342799 RepID=UPI0035BA072E
MLTYVARTNAERSARPSYRPFRAEVVRIEQLSPSFRRVTFTGAEFDRFGTARLDQRVKLVLPHADGSYGGDFWFDERSLDAGVWYQAWRELPDAERNPFRTYTVRALRAATSDRPVELDIDFVVHTTEHGADGPAAVWLASAAVGDEIVLVGPDDLSLDYRQGLDWHPGEAVDYLLAGDETAAPAICAILESLPAGTRAQAFLEVPTSGDRWEVETAADATITWLPRDAAPRLPDAVREWVETHRDRIAPALSATTQELADIDVDVEMLWDSPDDASGRFYAWLAGESACIKLLRRLLVSEIGVDRHRVAFMGYWRLGKAEGQ